MRRGACLAAAAMVLATQRVALADVTPPPRASITLSLTVDGQGSLPGLRFFVTNCREPLETSVLDPGAPLVCSPVPRAPVRVYGFPVESMPKLFGLLSQGAGATDSVEFAEKAKTCGSVLEDDLVFEPKSGVVFVEARYELAPGPKGGCKLTRVSGVAKKELPRVEPSAAPPAPTTKPGASAPTPAPPASGCGCRVGAPQNEPDAWRLGLVAMLGAAAFLRRRAS